MLMRSLAPVAALVLVGAVAVPDWAFALRPVGPRVPIAAAGLSPDVGMDAAGGFIVTWQESLGRTKGVLARRFDAEGNALGEVFTIVDDRGFAGVGVAPSGEFDVLWTDLTTLWVRRFTAGGTAGPFAVASGGYITGDIASAGAAGFAVVWNEFNFETDDHQIAARLFDGAGAPRGDEIPVSRERDDVLSDAPGISADGRGNLVLAWRRYILPAGIIDRLDANGTFVGGHDLGPDLYPNDVAAEPGGSFVVVHSGTVSPLRLHRFDAAGNLDGVPLLVSSSGSEGSIATNGAGRFVVVWSEDYAGVFAQRFECNADCVGTPSTTTTVAPGSSTTSTLSCTGARCSVHAVVTAPACAGAVPAPIASKLDRVVALLEEAGSANPPQKAKLDRRARKTLKRVATAVTRGTRGKTPVLSGECGRLLRDIIQLLRPSLS